MNLPPELKAIGEVEFLLPSGRTIGIPRTLARMRAWTGATPPWAQSGAPLVEAQGGPAPPATAILWLLRDAGWDGVWIDAGTYRTGLPDAPPLPRLPERASRLLEQAGARARGDKGIWDLLCWRDEDVLFLALRRAHGGQFRRQQLVWLESALLSGVLPDSFLIADWMVAES